VKTELKVRHLSDDVYQVVELLLSNEDYFEYEDDCTLYQGSLSDCEAYIRLKNSNLLL